jgi:hypothetical protein
VGSSKKQEKAAGATLQLKGKGGQNAVAAAGRRRRKLKRGARIVSTR